METGETYQSLSTAPFSYLLKIIEGLDQKQWIELKLKEAQAAKEQQMAAQNKGGRR